MNAVLMLLVLFMGLTLYIRAEDCVTQIGQKDCIREPQIQIQETNLHFLVPNEASIYFEDGNQRIDLMQELTRLQQQSNRSSENVSVLDSNQAQLSTAIIELARNDTVIHDRLGMQQAHLSMLNISLELRLSSALQTIGAETEQSLAHLNRSLAKALSDHSNKLNVTRIALEAELSSSLARADAMIALLEANNTNLRQENSVLNKRLNEQELRLTSYMETTDALLENITRSLQNLTDVTQIGSARFPARSCQRLFEELALPGQADFHGVYFLRGNDGEPYRAYCHTIAGQAYELAMNLDTSDGHVMWWGNELWQNSETYNDVTQAYSFGLGGDTKTMAWHRDVGYSHIMIVVHENGQIKGYRQFEASSGASLGSIFSEPCLFATADSVKPPGCNKVLGRSAGVLDTAGLDGKERLIKDSHTLYANRHSWQNQNWIDLDRLTSDTAAHPTGNHKIGNQGGGLGNWHDAGHGALKDGATSVVGIPSIASDAFRTTSEAQSGWCNYGADDSGFFGTDTYAEATCAQTDDDPTKAAWAGPNGINYDYAIFLGHLAARPPFWADPLVQPAFADCSALYKAYGSSMVSGVYKIKPDSGPQFDAYCHIIGSAAWTLLLNLDTSDGHVMWWLNPLWKSDSTYHDVKPGYSMTYDSKTSAYLRMASGTHVMIMIHEDGELVGWQAWERAFPGTTLHSHINRPCNPSSTSGCNQLLASARVSGAGQTSRIDPKERLVRLSATLRANQLVGRGDFDRIGSHESTCGSKDNCGGGLGNYHDAPQGDPGLWTGNRDGMSFSRSSSFRTVSEAQAGWCNYQGDTGGFFGSDSFGPATCANENVGFGNAAWAAPNGLNYDYAIFFGDL